MINAYGVEAGIEQTEAQAERARAEAEGLRRRLPFVEQRELADIENAFAAAGVNRENVRDSLATSNARIRLLAAQAGYNEQQTQQIISERDARVRLLLGQGRHADALAELTKVETQVLPATRQSEIGLRGVQQANIQAQTERTRLLMQEELDTLYAQRKVSEATRDKLRTMTPIEAYAELARGNLLTAQGQQVYADMQLNDLRAKQIGANIRLTRAQADQLREVLPYLAPEAEARTALAQAQAETERATLGYRISEFAQRAGLNDAQRRLLHEQILQEQIRVPVTINGQTVEMPLREAVTRLNAVDAHAAEALYRQHMLAKDTRTERRTESRERTKLRADQAKLATEAEAILGNPAVKSPTTIIPYTTQFNENAARPYLFLSLGGVLYKIDIPPNSIATTARQITAAYNAVNEGKSPAQQIPFETFLRDRFFPAIGANYDTNKKRFRAY